MFGYIRPVNGELTGNELEFYRSVYCGLCDYGSKNLSRFTRYFLNYDFVFLAVLRMALTGEPFGTVKKRCPYKIKKRPFAVAPIAFSQTCAAFAILNYYKLVDDIKDEKKYKRVLMPIVRRIKNKALGYGQLENVIALNLLELDAFEKSGETSLDKVADSFAKITKEIASFGLEGDKRRIAEECGYHLGRFIYIIDALDDCEKDAKNNQYNPLNKKYGNEISDHFPKIKLTLTDSLNAFSRAYALNGKTEFDGIIYNICELGGAAAIEKCLRNKEPCE